MPDNYNDLGYLSTTGHMLIVNRHSCPRSNSKDNAHPKFQYIVEFTNQSDLFEKSGFCFDISVGDSLANLSGIDQNNHLVISDCLEEALRSNRVVTREIILHLPERSDGMEPRCLFIAEPLYNNQANQSINHDNKTPHASSDVKSDNMRESTPNDPASSPKWCCRFIPFDWLNFAMRANNHYYEQLLEAEYLQRIDVLASSVVHDMNNTLIPIIGYTKMLMDELESDNPNHDILAQIAKAANRSRQLMQRVYTSSTLPEQEYLSQDLSLLVMETLKHLRGLVHEPIRLQTKIETLDRPVMLNPMQMRIVLLQLVRNAMESFSPRFQGTVEINLSVIGSQAKHTKQHPRLKDGAYALLLVKDNGGGMTDGQLEQAYDPFFTSVKPGKGKGLGLAMVHNIILEHNGEFIMESVIGEGTTNYVYLPFLEQMR